MDLEQLQRDLQPLCEDADIARLGVFGSVARGDDTAGSDVDLLVRFKRPVGLFELIGLQGKMAAAVNRPVDLGTENSLHPLIRQRVLRELRVIYEAE